MKEILELGGASFLIPAVLFGLVLYTARGLFGLHGRRSQNRKEFLELWDPVRSEDDLWLEVAVRHLFGTYLPAPIIRLAMTRPDTSQALLDLSELWPLFRFDPEAGSVSWLHQRHRTSRKRKLGRVVLFAGYFVCAGIALGAAVLASRYGPATVSGWIYGVCALLIGFAAFSCIDGEDKLKVAVTVGDEWLDRINRWAGQSTPRVLQGYPARVSSTGQPQSDEKSAL